ncbi:cysteine--tRNA ligase [Vagococcus humatus]|uniref:Cysteine--tRNA ligase n=1 Tax=Vagococcus humatus TaxID=1889241 RepID=A0A3S0AWQ5_9ENTE|nr:cysteine--tRNA ligase [Vagococcus humatus]RST88926.1 cysteine--tRNA ligase [Vagococcus humatus]
MIQIYNTLTRKKEDFQPINPEQVTMYVCGPTVYNYIHIGNARSSVAFDTVRKYLEYRGYNVHYVSNFTDVDDKIIRAAKEQKMTPKELADYYIEAFKKDTGALNIKEACEHPRVVEHMDDIIAFIEDLIEKDYAYASRGDVYYRTRRFKKYGQLSDQSIDELEVGASQRTGVEQAKKEDPLDFALWKSAKPEEIFWESPWGQGRPGWHIECSVMATKHLGNTIDIHGGGQDLEFPHHENEIAQSEAKTDQTFANYWMHNGYVTVGEGGEKMSKSLGNFVTVHELIKQVDPEVIRFALSTTQYRRPIPFNEQTLQDAKTNLDKIRMSFQNLLFRSQSSVESLATDSENLATLATFEEKFQIEMDDDFNTANGITVVYEVVKWLNHYLEQAEVSTKVCLAVKELLQTWLHIFGIELVEEAGSLDEKVEALIAERNQARQDKNFARSDEIRDLLKEEGIVLEDTAQGTRWRRLND